MINGTEFYRYQNHVNYVKLKDTDIRFVYAKATQGTTWTDPMFKTHRAGIILAGKDFGALHFLDYFNYPKDGEILFGRQQADYFYSVIKDNPGQCPFVLDIETNEGAAWPKISIYNVSKVLKIALAWHVRMKELTGRFGGDYVSGWITAYMKNFTEGFAWIPRYKAINNVQPKVDHFLSEAELSSYGKPSFGAFPKYTIFQYASTLDGKLVDFDGYIDADYFNGNEEEYSLWLGKTCVPTYPVETEDPVITTSDIKQGVTLQSVNIRTGIGTHSEIMTVAPKGANLDILERGLDTMGNEWIRCGYKQWACINYNGTPLIHFV